MLKQLTVGNLFNFKEEVTIDFVTSGKKESSFHIYNKDKISNFSLIYGKNNVGKSNLLRIISLAKEYILGVGMGLKAYQPEADQDEASLFEFILENENYEIRYGFELLISQGKIKDEWMYAKLNKSSRESLLFSRADLKIHSSFLVGESNILRDISERRLYISHFTDVNHKHDVIKDFLEMVENIKFVDFIDNLSNSSFKEKIVNIIGDELKLELFNSFLLAADLDLKQVDVQELTDAEVAIVERFRSIMISGEKDEVKEEKINKIINDNPKLIASLLGKELVMTEQQREDKQNLRYSAVKFLNQNGASFDSEDLSTGTRQVVNLLSTLVVNFDSPSIYLFDEIETGLHMDLITLVLDMFNNLIKITPDNQYIVTTHREEILDFDYISNDNKVLIKYDKEKKSPYVEYISQYKIREYMRISDRYRVDAFDSNPNTSYEYHLNNIIDVIAEKGAIYESEKKTIKTNGTAQKNVSVS